MSFTNVKSITFNVILIDPSKQKKSAVAEFLLFKDAVILLLLPVREDHYNTVPSPGSPSWW